MSMTFQLKDFDGPLDLLLHLVTQAQIDIRDIFVSQITDQYIEVINSAPELDMDDASEFLVMAATLLEIKSRSLLPKPPALPEDEPDPAEELIRRLEEYKRLKETTGPMHEFEAAAKELFTRLPDEFPLPPQEVELDGLTLPALTEALLRVLSRRPAETPEENRYSARDIHRDEHSVQGCMLILLRGLRRKGEIRFEDAFSEQVTREEVITLFLALLELMRLGQAHAVQEGPCGEILIRAGDGRKAEADGADTGNPARTD